MPKLRREYRDRLASLEDDLLAMGTRVLEMLSSCIEALARHDTDTARAVIRADDLLDAEYNDFEDGVLTTIALQSPVASELRLLTAFLHTNVHLERMGDLCVNISKFVLLVEDSADDPELMAQLQEMGGHARRVIARSLDALSRRDLDLVFSLPQLDEPLDQLNKGLFSRLVRLAATDEQRLDWAVSMVLVARYLERLGDHAVDIGEQVHFAVTGRRIELASNSPTVRS